MPNHCYVELHASGEPERIEEFWLLNSQHIHATPVDERLQPWFQSPPNSGKLPSQHLLAPRKYRDLTFSSLIPQSPRENGDGISIWGTKWDLDHSCNPLPSLDRSPTRVRHGEAFTRSLAVSFETANSPPLHWFAALTKRLPELTFAMSSYEQDNGVALVRSAKGGVVSDISLNGRGREVGPRVARKVAREGMPDKRPMNPLLIAIAEGDISGTLRYLANLDQSGLIDGMWPPIFHAAKAGSARVFTALLKEQPEHALYQTSSGIKLTDILLDVYQHQPADLVNARYQMAYDLAECAPDIWRQPLASSVSPAELGARFAMRPILDLLTAHKALLVKGSMSGWSRQIACDASAETLDDLCTRVGERYMHAVVENSARLAAERNDLPLLRQALKINPTVTQDTDDILCGRAETICGTKADPDFVAGYHAILAQGAISEVIATVRTSNSLRP